MNPFDLCYFLLRKAATFLAAVVVLLIALSIAGQLCKFVWGHDTVKGFVPLFYVDYESNVPTWYSSSALLLAAGLLGTIAWIKHTLQDPYRWHWSMLAIAFLLLSMDEIAMVHEYPIEPLRQYFHADGLFYYTWVIPGAVAVLILAVSLARFLIDLPPVTRRSFLLSGIVFVGGAIGIEMISGLVASRHGEENLTYSLVVTGEELLEMLGVVIFIHGLANYLVPLLEASRQLISPIVSES